MNNLLNRYNTTCEEAGFNRLGVMAFILLVQTCIIVPATLLALIMHGGGVIGFLLMAAFSFLILAVLLGDVKVKYVFPLFAISTLVHLGIFLYYMF